MAVASRSGHTDLVDVLVKQYGCSISDAEKVKHVKYGMTCYHHSVMRVTCGILCLFLVFIHFNISSRTSLPLLVIVLQTYYMNSEI